MRLVPVRSWDGGEQLDPGDLPPLVVLKARWWELHTRAESNPWLGVPYSDMSFRYTRFQDVSYKRPKLGDRGRARLAALERSPCSMACRSPEHGINASSAYWALAIWFRRREFRVSRSTSRQESESGTLGHAGNLLPNYLVWSRSALSPLDASTSPAEWKSPRRGPSRCTPIGNRGSHRP